VSRITAPALLVGSVPLDSAEDVLRASAAELGDVVEAYPDGEVGERINWVFYLAVRTYSGHPDIESLCDVGSGDIRQPEPGGSLEERAKGNPAFRLRPGVTSVRFESLHYAQPAIESYAVFRRLREAGEISAVARFQVAIPASGSAITSFFHEPADWDIVTAAYRDAVAREIDEILAAIPPEDLVIQYDIAAEGRDLYLGDRPALPWSPKRTSEEKWASYLADVAPLAAAVPESVVLGYHLCFGTWGGWPHTPGLEDLGVCVRLASEIVARTGRAVDYVHIPVLPDADEAFLEPLAGLDLGDTRLYLGIVYHDGPEACRRRIERIEPLVEDFGVAWYCGFGRLPADEVAPIMREIRLGAEQLRGSRVR
jgi:hypothetical protein